MQKLLTIIVPVYKVEKYINKCLESLIVSDTQMADIEVIVVNDGTPDNSAIMAKEYEKRYPNTFKVIDKENGGHGSAWNKGVELATGKYLRFLDSDDWLTNLSDFLRMLENVDVDLVFTDLLNVYENTPEKNRIHSCSVAMTSNVVYDVEQFEWEKTNKVFNGHNITNFHMCTYRTDILKQHHPVFLEKMFYDDEILFVLPLCFAKKIVYFNITLYNYLNGRVGQTMDPKVMAKNVGFKVKIRKYTVDFYNKYKPQKSNVIKKIQNVLNSRTTNTFKLMALLPYKDYIEQTKDWEDWIRDNYRDFKGGRIIMIYKKLPILFWVLYHWVRPFWNTCKRLV